MTTISPDILAHVFGGAGASTSTPDPQAPLKRAQDLKPGKNNVDLYGYKETNSQGIGAEYRRRLSPNASIFINGHTGTKDDKPDSGVMGGIRFEW